jgi:hypothetical protein
MDFSHRLVKFGLEVVLNASGFGTI